MLQIRKAAGMGSDALCHVCAKNRVCRSWQMAVRCGLDSMVPNPKHCCFESLRSFFPRVRVLSLD
jgi:hypothetical protein